MKLRDFYCATNAIEVSFLFLSVKNEHNNHERKIRMKNFYQMSANEVKQEVNGSLEPLTDQQVASNQEVYP